MTFEEWLTYGVTEGWVSMGVCETHDGVPMTPEEQDADEDGWDPCIPGLRVWEQNL
jgi:hypothetical protein